MARAKAKPKAKSANGLPEGFQTVEGFANQWDVEKMPTLQGVWGKVRTLTVKRGKKEEEQKVCEVETDDGTRYTVWESATLKAAFAQIEEGQQVFIRYEGLGKAKKGQNAPKLFTVAYK